MRKSILSAALLLALVAVVPALAEVAPEEPEPVGDTILGYVTSISETQIFVEEDPSIDLPLEPATGCEGKIYLTVTGETSILRLQGGALVPASFEDLAVGQLVTATDTGVVATSCPPQGSADSIVILDELPGSPGSTGFEQYGNAG